MSPPCNDCQLNCSSSDTEAGSCLSTVACRAKEQHAFHGKCRKHQISNGVLLDLMTVQLMGLIPDWAKLYPLHQHAGNKEAGDDLPNIWPPRVAATTYLAVSHLCMLLNAVPHCSLMQHDAMMCMVQLLHQADIWAHWVTLCSCMYTAGKEQQPVTDAVLPVPVL